MESDEISLMETDDVDRLWIVKMKEWITKIEQGEMTLNDLRSYLLKLETHLES